VTSETSGQLEEQMTRRMLDMGDGEAGQLLTIYQDGDGTLEIGTESLLPPAATCQYHTVAEHLREVARVIAGRPPGRAMPWLGFWGLMLIVRTEMLIIEGATEAGTESGRMGVIISRMSAERPLVAVLGSGGELLAEDPDVGFLFTGPSPERLLYPVLGAIMAVCS
jgi:hypothetical protein